jgi:hypothetical protein
VCLAQFLRFSLRAAALVAATPALGERAVSKEAGLVARAALKKQQADHLAAGLWHRSASQ